MRRVDTYHTVLKKISPRPRPHRAWTAIFFPRSRALGKTVQQLNTLQPDHFPSWTGIPQHLSPVKRCATQPQVQVSTKGDVATYSAGLSSSKRCCTPAMMFVSRLTLLLASSKPGSKSETTTPRPLRIVFQIYRDIQSVHRYTSRDALRVRTPISHPSLL
ncbi:unnamed protein product [Ectocarpus sp. 12 AP-2014]